MIHPNSKDVFSIIKSRFFEHVELRTTIVRADIS